MNEHHVPLLRLSLLLHSVRLGEVSADELMAGKCVCVCCCVEVVASGHVGLRVKHKGESVGVISVWRR